VIERGDTIERDVLLRKLVDMQYQRSDYDFSARNVPRTGRRRRDLSRLRGGTRDPGRALRRHGRVAVRDRSVARHGAASDRAASTSIRRATTSRRSPTSSALVDQIRTELKDRLDVLRDERKLLEAQRLEQRTLYDLEIWREMGFCPGIEKLRPPPRRATPGEPPYTLLDYFPATTSS
jgi:excinuclease ABC subunit B